jgi:hypothetical protein
MEHPGYFIIDIVALALAAAMTAIVVAVGYELMHDLADQVPPALSG